MCLQGASFREEGGVRSASVYFSSSFFRAVLWTCSSCCYGMECAEFLGFGFSPLFVFFFGVFSWSFLSLEEEELMTHRTLMLQWSFHGWGSGWTGLRRNLRAGRRWFADFSHQQNQSFAVLHSKPTWSCSKQCKTEIQSFTHFFFPFPVSVLIFHQCFHTTLPTSQPKPIQESMNPNPTHIRSLWGTPEKKKKIQKSCLPIPAFPLHLLFKYIYYWNKFKSKSSLLSAEHFSSSHTPLGTTTPRTNFLLTLCLPCRRFSPICWNIFQLFIPALGTPGKGVQGWEHLAASLVMVTH